MTLLTEFKQNHPSDLDKLTTAAGVIATRIEKDQRKKPESERLTGPEKKALVVSELEQNVMTLGHAVNMATGNNPLITAGINFTGPMLEEIVQTGFEGAKAVWDAIVDFFDGDN